MYVEVAHYKLGKGSVEELLVRVQAGPLRVMPEVPGFVDYYAFDAGDGNVVSVSIFTRREGGEEAGSRLASWIEETMTEFAISPVGVTEGEVFATTSTTG